jgi:hypothetical protein
MAERPSCRASHDIGERPSQTIAQVLHVLKWFAIHRKPDKTVSEPGQAKEGGR